MKQGIKNLSAATLIVIAGILPGLGFGQEQPKADTVKLPVNAEYDKASHLKRILFDELCRKGWASVDFPVLNLDAEAGGLTAGKLEGGFQTKSLQLKGADGKGYILRSVNKDASKTLPPELAGILASVLLQDQISSSNPKESRQYISDDTLKKDFKRRAFLYDWLAELFSRNRNLEKSPMDQ